MSGAGGAIAIVGVSAILPDAPNADAFWRNLTEGHYCISEVDPGRWDPDLYFDPDPKAPDHTYSKIGGWVRDWEWDPLGWKLPIPPKVSDAMDDAQKWGLACTRMALLDYGWPERPLDFERTAVVFGNAMSGEHHYLTALRLSFPELARELAKAPSYAGLPDGEQKAIARELHSNMEDWLPPVTEDTMPGELGNCLAGRVANLFNLRGPNFVVDAACASAMAAMDASIEGLIEREFDAVITGGIDRNMGASTFIKFSAIGALSASGTRPYAESADGFVMGEGAALFVLKRLEDAERDGDRVYAVVRGVAGASDGKGKGITAPNPIGQKLAVERAWRKSGLSPEVCSLVEGHGTSTAVGDVVEVESLSEAFSAARLGPHSVALGSVKSNIGHLKGGAGAAGLLKAALSLHHKVLPPSLNFDRPNPNIDWSSSPFAVNTELRDWETHDHEPRVAAVSAFGFGGTNFHAVLEEHVPGRLTGDGAASISVPAELKPANARAAAAPPRGANGGRESPSPLRGALVLGTPDEAALTKALAAVLEEARAGRAPVPAPPEAETLRSAERLAIDYADADELAAKAELSLKALESGVPAAWRALRARGIFRGSGPAPKVAFLYTGQGSQYANMLAVLRQRVPLVAETFDEADEVMRPLLGGRMLSDVIFVDPDDPRAMAEAEADLMRTEITQPAVLTVDIALTHLLESYGITPDFVMGHSLGEYAALVTAGVLRFDESLEAVSARGQGMASLELEDPGAMAAVMAPPDVVQEVVGATEGYVVLANLNSENQVVLGGASEPVARAVAGFQERGHTAMPLPVSHAFHTEIVAPASEPLRAMLRRLDLSPPRMPIVANVDGEFYPTGPDVEERIVDILGRQVASPVQFVKGLHTLFDAGARVFVETGPKRALHGFASDVLGEEEALNLYANHPKLGDLVSFNHALCGLYSAGLGIGRESESTAGAPPPPMAQVEPSGSSAHSQRSDDTYRELGRLSAEFLRRGSELLGGDGRPAEGPPEPTVITGAALGLPGTDRIFDDHNVARILHGEQFIDVIDSRVRHEILNRRITRLVKGDDGSAHFESIDDVADVIKLAAQGGELDLAEEFGVDADRVAAFGRSTQLAIGAGIDALRDAGIPLVLHYKTTTKGTQLPHRWQLPADLRDDTAIIFASAFPGLEEFAAETEKFSADRSRRDRLSELEALRARLTDHEDSEALAEVDRHIHDLRLELEEQPYQFDRRFLFRVLSMGHSQFAELIGARGPNTQVNAACASTTQAVAIAEDWIRAGRCRRAIVVAADDATSDELLPWIGAGFLASGAAATDDVVEEAALPFDRRRHGMLIGMGAAALVVESAEAARERGITPICEVLSASTANSAFHGTRLDVDHIGGVMEQVVARAEASGVDRRAMSGELVFVSHETYTPARGGSAAAEIHALRKVFGEDADKVLIANTKGVTGHPMGVGLEDVVAIKSLETGVVPPVPNFREVDPELGELNLSKGGAYPVSYALRLAAGFGSQISMMLLHWTPVRDGSHRAPEELGYAYRIADQDRWTAWLRAVSAQESPELEVVQHRLRVVDCGPTEAVATPAAEPPVAVPLGAPVSEPAPEPVTEAPPAAEPAPPAEPAPAEAEPTPAETPSAAGDPTERILALVAEETGYPSDLLDLDLDLEADLGIDTVKQAEVFAAIREAYDIPFDETLKLRDYPTLNHVVGFVRERAGIGEAEPAAEAPPAAEPAPPAEPAPAEAEPTPAETPSAAGDPTERILALVAEETGYPSDLLDLDLDLEADLGIDTVKQAEVFAAIREAYDIPFDETLKLRDYPTLNHVVGFVRERAGIGEAEPAAEAPPAAEPAPPAEPAPAEAEPTPAETPSAAGDPTERILALVAEETGYPSDLLDLDLDLEADLGIDTVKQAEVFAAIREAYDIPFDETLKLRDYPTLNHVVGFVRERAGIGAEEPAPEEPPPAADETPAGGQAGQFPRRIPVPVVRPPLQVCVPTGVSLEAPRRVIVMPDSGGVAEALEKKLLKLGVEVLAVDPQADDIESRIQGWIGDGPVHGVYWLPALDAEPPIAELDPEGWAEGLRVRVKLLARALRELAEQIDGEDTFLVAGTRLGGRHGYDADGATSAMGGAVTGFVKSLARERPDALVKAVDFPPSRKTAALADLLIEETLRDPGVVEVGHADDLRWSVGLVERAAEADPEEALGAETVFCVTGGAGSIVSAITADLAAASGGTFHLLDLVDEPDPDDPDLAKFSSDREGLKRELADRIKERGERPTPKLVERELSRIERARAALDAIEAVREAGGKAYWHQVDLTDPERVSAAVTDVLRDSGRIDALIHCAGLEVSHFLPDKPQAEFDLVFDVKVNGWFNLLHALGDSGFGAAVVFSSIAGRFGNAGQTDYAAANDLLCKSASRLRGEGIRGIAIDWTAWAEIGMASRGSIPKVMEMAGIDMLPPKQGVPVVRRELTAAGPGAEVLVAGALGLMLEQRHPTGGLDLDAATEAINAHHGPMSGRVVGFGSSDALTVVTELDPSHQAFLNDHRIDGTPVLPGVMGIEGFAEAAAALLPGWRVTALEDIELTAPFKFYRDEPRALELTVLHRDRGDGTLVADCRLLGTRSVPQGEQRTVHFTGRAVLARELAQPSDQESAPEEAEEDGGVGPEAIYGIYFHGPAYQVLERAWRHNGDVVGRFAADLPPDHEPADEPTVAAPRLIELCFQTAGVWELGTLGRMALPTHVDRVIRYADADEPGNLFAVVHPREDGSAIDARVVDEKGRVRVLLSGYRTIELPGALDPEALEPIRSAMS